MLARAIPTVLAGPQRLLCKPSSRHHRAATLAHDCSRGVSVNSRRLLCRVNAIACMRMPVPFSDFDEHPEAAPEFPPVRGLRDFQQPVARVSAWQTSRSFSGLSVVIGSPR
jgi:hypothetical protein